MGSIDDFEKRVKEVHAGTKHEAVYLAAIAMARAQLEWMLLFGIRLQGDRR